MPNGCLLRNLPLPPVRRGHSPPLLRMAPTKLRELRARRPKTLTTSPNGHHVDTQTQILRILDDALSLGGRTARFNADTPLLGSLPELDSMGVVTLIGALEDQLGVSVDDDEISGDTFATVGSLSAFVADKLGG